MNDDAYDAFHEEMDHVEEPVHFEFTEEEVNKLDVPQGEPLAFSDGTRHDLQEHGYPYLRAALIFAVMGERLK